MKIHSKKSLIFAAAISIVAGMLSIFQVLPLLSGIALLAWLLTGPGIVATSITHFNRTTRVLLAALTGPTLVFGFTVIAAWFGNWRPLALTVIFCLLTAILSCVLLMFPSQERVTVESRVHQHFGEARASLLSAPGGMLALCVLLVIGFLPTLPYLPAEQFGLLTALPSGPVIIAANIIVVVVFLLGLRRKDSYLVGAATVALVITFRLPTAFSSSAPLYGWTYKHLGVVDYIMQTGQLAHGLDIYNSWPTLFSATAWFVQSSGISAMSVASWFIIFVHLAQAPAIYALARSFGQQRIIALSAAFLGELFNWVGQDYFSPQALAFVLAIYFLALVLRSRQEPKIIWWTLPLFALLTITHQLTPYWLMAIVTALCIFKLVRPRWLFLLLIAMAGSWLALNYGSVAHYGLFSGFDPLANASRPKLGTGSLAYTIVQNGMRATAVIIWAVTGLLVAAMLWRQRKVKGLGRFKEALLPAILLFSPFMLLGGQSYGGEAIFRVLLYSLPICSVLIAGWLAPLLWGGEGHSQPNWRFILALLTTIVFAAVSLQNVYGPWFNNVVTAQVYSKGVKLLKTVPTGSLTVSISPPGAGRATADYVRLARNKPWFDMSLLEASDKVKEQTFATDASVNNLTNLLASESTKQVYIIWTGEMQNYVDYYGIFKPGAIKNLVSKLETSFRWEAVTNEQDLKIFKLKQGD